MIKKWIVPVLFVLAFSFSAAAAEFSRASIPDPLRSWVGWVLDADPAAACPHLFNDSAARQCAWPGALELKVSGSGAGFTQDWQVYHESWVMLPGDASLWPLEVSVDGKPGAILSRDGGPAIKLSTGSHRISGRFVWNALPESLALPANAGLLRLDVNGQNVNFPLRDDSNRLWLQRKADAEGSEQAQVRLYRKISDGVPLMVETRIRLEVSGKGRELVLGRALLAGLIARQLSSPLPAVLEPDGSLKVQARAGIWDIILQARHDGPLQALALPAAPGLVAAEEVWVFEAAPLIRSVNISGPAALDTRQTSLPLEWRNLPGFLMLPDSRFSIKEIRRGDSDPAPDKLSLQRRLWLHFDGSGMSMNDRIQGEISRTARLSMGAGAALGRVDIAGQDQVITRGADQLAGIEVKRGALNLSADSSTSGSWRNLAALGWKHDFDHVAMELSLPPGWRLLHAGGTDRAEGAWLARWNLLDFFLVLVIALAAGQLWGRNWGLLALAALVLSYQEADAPRFAWIVLLAAVAVQRALPEGRVKFWINWLQRASLLALLLISLVFATEQLRTTLYPVLEQGGRGTFGVDGAVPAAAPIAGPAVAPASPVAEEVLAESPPVSPPPSPAPPVGLRMDQAGLTQSGNKQQDSVLIKEVSPPQALGSLPYGAALTKRVATAAAPRSYQSIDPDARVQTGPGLPDWQWQSYRLSWDGPVRQDQQLDLWLLSPWMNKIVVLLRLSLLALLLACAAGLLKSQGQQGGGDVAGGVAGKAGGLRFWRRKSGVAVYWFSILSFTLALAVSVGSGNVQAQMPSAEQLAELKEKLTRPDECLPECAEISRLSLQLSGNSLRLGLELDAAIDTALPLPGGVKHWLPREARLDGRLAYAQRDAQGLLWLLLPAGRHRLELSGDLSNPDTLQLPLPRKPRKVEISAEGWEVTGWSDETGAADTLQLSRRVKAGAGAEAPLLPPFLRVERRLILDLVWRVETTVWRDSPQGTAALLQIPLLPGEAVTSPGVNVKDGKVLVNLGPQADSLSWSSTLAQVPELKLVAAKDSAWVESWVIAASTLWHVTADGIPPVAMEPGYDADLAFRPWPGEVLKLQIARPQAITGQTLTIDQSRLVIKPGARATDYALALVVRSSRGTDHSISLPAGAVLQSVHINGQLRPIRANGGQLLLPLLPGRQSINIVWRVDQGMALSYASLPFKLEMLSVNHRLSLQMPHERWLLLASGPGVGPAILFWGKLLILLALAVALGRIRSLPMKTRHWVLLALGLTQVQWWAASLVIAWFFAFSLRAKAVAGSSATWLFNWRQIALLALTVTMLSVLLVAVQGGLLGWPDMQVAGNNSSREQLNWYLDRAGIELPGVWVLSLPIMLYRGLMLVWALWLAWSLLAWLKWGWAAFCTDGLWRSTPKALKSQAVQPPQSSHSAEVPASVQAQEHSES